MRLEVDVRHFIDGLGQKKLMQVRLKKKLASNNKVRVAVQLKTMVMKCEMYTYCRGAIARQTFRRRSRAKETHSGSTKDEASKQQRRVRGSAVQNDDDEVQNVFGPSDAVLGSSLLRTYLHNCVLDYN